MDVVHGHQGESIDGNRIQGSKDDHRPDNGFNK